MSFHEGIMWFAAIGAVLGGVDHLCGNKLGLGKKFQEGLDIMGALALSMTGIIVLAPVLAGWLQPVLLSVFRFMHADSALFASIIANDMGGYPLAMLLAESREMGLLSGCIIASMLGCTLTYSIPLGFGIIDKEHNGDFVHGLLLGLTTIPVGGVVGGLIAGFDPAAVLINNVPIAIVSIGLAIGFKLWPKAVRKLAEGFCTLIRWIAVAGIVIGAFTKLTGVVVPGFEDADSLMAAFAVVAEIAVTLIGILPMLELLMRLLKKPLNAIGKRIGINSVAAGGMIYTLANPLPVFSMFRDMDKRGRIVNVAWLVTASAALGDHLGFTAGVEPEMIVPMIAGKLIAAVCAAALVLFQTRKMDESEA